MESKKFKIEKEFEVNYYKVADDRYVCHIPYFDIHFGAMESEIEKKATAMVQIWINFFVEENRNYK